MTHFKKLTLALVATSAIIATNHAALAVDSDVGATANFREALALSNVVDMDYGTIEYSGTGAGTATMNPDSGALTCTGADYTCPASGTVGSVDIGGTTGESVQITCDQTATLVNGANEITLDTAKIFIDSTETTCGGVGVGGYAFNLTAGTDTVQVGGRLDIESADVIPGDFTTAGDKVTVRVLYN